MQVVPIIARVEMAHNERFIIYMKNEETRVTESIDQMRMVF